MTTTTRYAFDTDTASTALGEHEYAIDLSPRWITGAGTANGGYLLACCLRALSRQIPQPDLLSASAHYLRPGGTGPARIRTETARVGRRTGTGAATLLREDKEIVRVLATFTDLASAQGRTHESGEPPRLPPPDRCVDPLAGISAASATIAARVEFRMAEVPGFFRGAPGGTTALDFWLRFADGREPDPIALALLVDSAAPAVFDLGVAGSSTVELTVHIRRRPAPGWLACRVRTAHLVNGFHEEDFDIWDSTGALVAQSRQLAILL
ncbi:thioesterase family protein [Nocardia bovistercoris]|uniref:Thioesterase family protein n=1 Tax=Nocardia bovistercoris TaxID=2785916 RepID=A0A931IE03_9NOCA|nr:thioesterase family protein [Nocardia bovistercoris]MBH0779456.1 thioesterase family protein [Nocardia bovistercoris]